MRVAETEPERLRFLLRPFVYYSKNRTLLRIVTGEYAGLEGYVIRIARDRKLVMDVGGMAVALSCVHAERFEEVNKNEADKKERELFYKRNLHERNAFIDRYFHRVKTAQEVAAQVENIEILRLQTLADVRDKKLDLKDAYDTFYFMIEEIGYYYAPFIDYFKDELRPIFEAGRTVKEEIEKAIPLYNKAGGKVLKGLTIRRNKELALFKKGNTNNIYYPPYTGTSLSIIDALKSVGEKDTSYNHRKQIAKTNGVLEYKGSKQQNELLLSLLIISSANFLASASDKPLLSSTVTSICLVLISP